MASGVKGLFEVLHVGDLFVEDKGVGECHGKVLYVDSHREVLGI